MLYRYTVYTNDKRLVEGTIESSSREMAEDSLYKAGFQRIINIEQTKKGINWQKIIGYSTKVKRETLLDFTTELEILTESGLTLLMALKQLEKQISDKSMKDIIGDMAVDIQGGTPFHEALSKHPKAFSETYCSIMEANEKAGTLDAGLRQIVKELRQQIAVRSQVQKSITQPLIIVGLAIVVAVIMIVVVLPQLTSIFDQFGGDLPFTAQLLVGLSDFIVNYKYYILLVVLLLCLVIYIFLRNPSTKKLYDKWVFSVPLFGEVIRWNETARFSRTLSNLLGSGILLPDSINIMLRTVSNTHFRNSLSQVRKELIQGQSLSSTIRKNEIFPSLLSELVGVGEASGNLEFALGTVADYFEAKVEKRINRLTSMLEPTLIIIVGLVVGLIAITMISTIYGLVGTFNV
jgi:type IV pilus assembly protein PilC